MLNETTVRSVGYFIEFLFKMLPVMTLMFLALALYWKK
jgi:hypothetical protein